ncbi:MAG: HD domain-containing protein [Gemmatimonadetes bacterium]|nr:HD domain-containing protein [Gemmatimonadota bacterium]
MITQATRFLRAAEHALELRLRPGAEAPLRRAADEACRARLADLAEAEATTVLRFAPAGVRLGELPLAEFERWPWGARLAARGIERLELSGGPSLGAVAAFLDHAAGLVPGATAPPRLGGGGLRWGPELEAAPAGYPLAEELGVMRGVFRRAQNGERLSIGDVHAVGSSLGALVGGDEDPGLPLLLVPEREDYLPAHALNTALLALAVAEPLGLGPEERHETAIAALLHDIGMARLPAETLVASPFTDQDRARVRVHPMEGARLLLSHGEQLESAAVVAYEHHLRMDGGGYPRLSYPREPHALTRVIAVCGAFDALLAHRPDRASLEPALALRELERNAVTQFDGRVVGAFAEVMLQSARRGRLALTIR